MDRVKRHRTDVFHNPEQHPVSCFFFFRFLARIDPLYNPSIRDGGGGGVLFAAKRWLCKDKKKKSKKRKNNTVFVIERWLQRQIEREETGNEGSVEDMCFPTFRGQTFLLSQGRGRHPTGETHRADRVLILSFRWSTCSLQTLRDIITLFSVGSSQRVTIRSFGSSVTRKPAS